MEQAKGMADQGRDGQTNQDCRKCRGQGVVVMPSSTHAEAAVCECSSRCLVCRGSRYLIEKDALGREIAKMCACEERRVRVRLFNEAGVPGKYYDARLREQNRDKANADAFNTFQLLSRDYQKGHKGIVLMGHPGVGKTWLVSAFIYDLIFTHGTPVLFRDFFHLLNELKSGYSQNKPESELIDPLVAVEVLVIDELGKGRNSVWEQNILDVIISQRYNAQKTTIFTSNYTDSSRTTLTERVRSKDPSLDSDVIVRDTLADRIGPRIYSRLKEMCDFVAMRGPDRRDLDGSGAGA